MTGAVHALIGAALGAFCGKKSTAFLSGVASHILADALPHSDLKPSAEIPTMLGALALIAKLKGINSKEFAGALGAIAPDIEHGLLLLGMIEREQEFFPTHINEGKLHGPDSGEKISQILIASASLITLLLKDN